jgi:hypothetical protein
MARPSSPNNQQGPHDIAALVRGFVSSLIAAVEQNTTYRIKVALVGNGRGGGVAGRTALRSSGAPRPKQLCPVPGCKNPAAPVFGMVCAEHKNVAKTKIKEYREARRRSKGAGKGKAPPRRVSGRPGRRPALRSGGGERAAAQSA